MVVILEIGGHLGFFWWLTGFLEKVVPKEYLCQVWWLYHKVNDYLINLPDYILQTWREYKQQVSCALSVSFSSIPPPLCCFLLSLFQWVERKVRLSFFKATLPVWMHTQANLSSRYVATAASSWSWWRWLFTPLLAFKKSWKYFAV